MCVRSLCFIVCFFVLNFRFRKYVNCSISDVGYVFDVLVGAFRVAFYVLVLFGAPASNH